MKKKIEMKVYAGNSFPKGTDAITAMGKLEEQNMLPAKVFMKYNEDFLYYELFVDSCEEGNQFAKVKQTDEIDEIYKEIKNGNPYEIRLFKGITERIFRGELEVFLEEQAKPQTVTHALSKEIHDAKKQAVSEGIKEALADLAIQTMKNNRCPDQLILMVMKGWKVYEEPIKMPKTMYVEPEGNGPGVFAKALMELCLGHNVLLEGDRATGKSVCSETLAFVRMQPFYMSTPHMGMTIEEVFGSKMTDNSASEGLTLELADAYVRYTKGDISQVAKAAEFELMKAKAASVSIIQETSPFVKAFTTGSFFCLNEANMMEANLAAAMLNPAGDNTGYYDVSGKGRLETKPGFCIVATQNAGYTGTCEQNNATMSRFSCIQVPFPKSIKNTLFAALPNASDKVVTAADKIYQSFLKAVHKETVDNACLNIRGFIRAIESTEAIPGFTTLQEQLIMQVINTCPEEDREDLSIIISETV